MELNDRVYEKVKKYCDEGNELSEKNHFKAAINCFEKAYEIIPDPKRNWEASTWISASIGDCYYFSEEFNKSLVYFEEAYNCPGGNENPFILLRIGENHFELSNYEAAKEYLLKAYMLEGYDIFKDEEKKYYRYIKEDSQKVGQLPPMINDEVEELIEKSNSEYDEEKKELSLLTLEKAFSRIPIPTDDYEISYTILDYLTRGYYEIDEKLKAKKWGKKLIKTKIYGFNDGDREFLLGKILYDLKEFEEAKGCFLKAYELSKGRVFIDEEKKYLDFIKEEI